MVIERPAAVAPRTGLESLPGAVDHRARGDREQRTERRVDAGRGVGNELGAVGLDANPGARSLGGSAHGVDRAQVQDLIVVGKRERAQSLANSHSSIEIAVVKAPLSFDELMLPEPIA